MNRKTHGCVALSLLMTFAILAGCQAQPPAPGNLDAFARQLDGRIPALLARYDVPGVAVALVHYGALAWSQGYGVADRARGMPVTRDTVFKSASVSKAVTAWGIMRLVQEGRLELDAPAGRYLRRWHLPPSKYDAGAVTIRRLLSHTAGISPHIPRGIPARQPLPSLELELSGSGGLTSPVRLAMPPGMQYSYTGGGYTILQLIVEEVTGESFAAYMQRAVLDPLGMLHSSFEWRTELRSLTAVGYGPRGNAYANDLSAESAAAGLYTTAPDLARLIAAGMPGPNGEPAGRGVLSPDAVDLMYTPLTAAQGYQALAGGTMALGHFVELLPDGTPAVAHAGTNWGWQAVFFSLPGRGDGIVILTNSTRGTALYAELLAAWGDWMGTGSPRVSRLYQSLHLAVIGLGAALAIGLVVAAGALWRAARSGRRRWLWRFSDKPGVRAYLYFAFLVLISLLLAFAWVLVAHSVLDWMIGKLAYQLTVPVLAWCAFGLVTALLRRAPETGS